MFFAFVGPILRMPTLLYLAGVPGGLEARDPLEGHGDLGRHGRSERRAHDCDSGDDQRERARLRAPGQHWVSSLRWLSGSPGREIMHGRGPRWKALRDQNSPGLGVHVHN